MLGRSIANYTDELRTLQQTEDLRGIARLKEKELQFNSMSNQNRISLGCLQGNTSKFKKASIKVRCQWLFTLTNSQTWRWWMTLTDCCTTHLPGILLFIFTWLSAWREPQGILIGWAAAVALFLSSNGCRQQLCSSQQIEYRNSFGRRNCI